MGSIANSYMRKGFLIYEMRKYLVIYEEVVSHICMTCNRFLLDFLIYHQVDPNF